MTPRRVVITGLGAVTPVGLDVASSWAALVAGTSGIGPVTQFDAAPFATRLAGEVKGFDPASCMDRKDARRTDRFAQFAIAATVQAMADAGIAMEREDSDRVGVIIGSGIGGFATMEDQHTTLVQKGPGRVSPFVIPMLLINMAAGLVAMRFKARGPNTAVVTACASGGNAIGDAFRTVAHGDADVMIAGGTEAAITPFGFAGFCNMGAMSTRNDLGPAASSPFDKGRDGFVMGEGAGILILESLEHATARGARVYAELAGYGQSSDAHHMTAPDPDGAGAASAMTRALRDAGVEPGAVDYINAHGTSTQLNDKTETVAIKRVLGEHARNVLVSSTKSMTGHMLGAAGAVEALVSVLALVHGVVPPTANYREPDEACDLNCVPNTAVTRPLAIAMSNSFGFGGHNAVLVIKSWNNAPKR